MYFLYKIQLLVFLSGHLSHCYYVSACFSQQMEFSVLLDGMYYLWRVAVDLFSASVYNLDLNI